MVFCRVLVKGPFGDLRVMDFASMREMMDNMWSTMINGQGQDACNSRDLHTYFSLGQGQFDLLDWETQWLEVWQDQVRYLSGTAETGQDSRSQDEQNITRVKKVQIVVGQKAIIFFPVLQLNFFQGNSNLDNCELERHFTRKHVVFIVQRKILPWQLGKLHKKIHRSITDASPWLYYMSSLRIWSSNVKLNMKES